jgi:hypothetical protein
MPSPVPRFNHSTKNQSPKSELRERARIPDIRHIDLLQVDCQAKNQSYELLAGGRKSCFSAVVRWRDSCNTPRPWKCVSMLADFVRSQSIAKWQNQHATSPSFLPLAQVVWTPDVGAFVAVAVSGA